MLMEPPQPFNPQFHNPHSDSDAASDARLQIQPRQVGVGGPAGPNQQGIPTTSIATQMSPVTTYWADGHQVVFTQTFAPTPDPWPAPLQGSIGL